MRVINHFQPLNNSTMDFSRAILLFSIASFCGAENKTLQAKDIIYNYDAIKNNVIVKFTHLDSPESYSLE